MGLFSAAYGICSKVGEELSDVIRSCQFSAQETYCQKASGLDLGNREEELFLMANFAHKDAFRYKTDIVLVWTGLIGAWWSLGYAHLMGLLPLKGVPSEMNEWLIQGAVGGGFAAASLSSVVLGCLSSRARSFERECDRERESL